MLLAFQIFAGLAALLHVVIFLMESVLWTKPQVYRRFGLQSADDAATTKPLAYNEGFYNLFLAIGIFIGIAIGGESGEILTVFALSSIVAAALVLVSAGLSYLRAAATQATFAIIALVLWALLPA